MDKNHRYGETDLLIQCIDGKDITPPNYQSLSGKSYEEMRLQEYEEPVVTLAALNEKALASQNTFVNLLGKSEVIRVLVGEQGSEWTIHQHLLTKSSKVVAAAMSREYKESSERIIRFPEEDPTFFETYVKYLYTGCLMAQELNSLIKLYVLADHLQADKFGEIVHDFIEQTYERYTTAQIEYVFENTISSDPLRRSLSEKLGQQVLKGDYSFATLKEQEFLYKYAADVMEGLLNVQEKKLSSQSSGPQSQLGDKFPSTKPLLKEMTTIHLREPFHIVAKRTTPWTITTNMSKPPKRPADEPLKRPEDEPLDTGFRGLSLNASQESASDTAVNSNRPTPSNVTSQVITSFNFNTNVDESVNRGFGAPNNFGGLSGSDTPNAFSASGGFGASSGVHASRGLRGSGMFSTSRGVGASRGIMSSRDFGTSNAVGASPRSRGSERLSASSGLGTSSSAGAKASVSGSSIFGALSDLSTSEGVDASGGPDHAGGSSGLGAPSIFATSNSISSSGTSTGLDASGSFSLERSPERISNAGTSSDRQSSINYPNQLATSSGDATETRMGKAFNSGPSDTAGLDASRSVDLDKKPMSGSNPATASSERDTVPETSVPSNSASLYTTVIPDQEVRATSCSSVPNLSDQKKLPD